MCSDGEVGAWSPILKKKKKKHKKSNISTENVKLSKNAGSQANWMQPEIVVNFPDGFAVSKYHDSDLKINRKILLFYSFDIRRM